jgi:hypothetical protein
MDAIVEKSIGLDGEVFAERRATPRRRVLKGATLSFNKGYGALECVVRNESEKGALLSFGETSAVPPAFNMTIKGSDVTRRAQVRWRTMTRIGVEFV